jgi:hypothetical protein
MVRNVHVGNHYLSPEAQADIVTRRLKAAMATIPPTC